MGGDNGDGMRYLIVRPENGGILDLFRFLVWDNRVCASKFLEGSEDDVDELIRGTSEPADHRWVIIVSIVMRKLIAVFGKPMEWAGYLFEFFLNLLSLNGNNLFALISNFFRGTISTTLSYYINFFILFCHLSINALDTWEATFYTLHHLYSRYNFSKLTSLKLGKIIRGLK